MIRLYSDWLDERRTERPWWEATRGEFACFGVVKGSETWNWVAWYCVCVCALQRSQTETQRARGDDDVGGKKEMLIPHMLPSDINWKGKGERVVHNNCLQGPNINYILHLYLLILLTTLHVNRLHLVFAGRTPATRSRPMLISPQMLTLKCRLK